MPDICIRGLVVMIIATWCLPTGAQPNNWTSPSSGRWEDSTWSLGVPPTTNHWIMITNAPSKAVAIFPDTPINFPSTMTVSNLTVSSPTGYVNTFLLNYSGTSHPLRVLNDVNVLDGGVINNQYGALKVDGSMLVMNGSVLMEGALLIVTNRPSSFALDVLSSSLFQTGGVIQACLQLVNSDYSLNNGVLRGSLEIGWLGSGHSYCSQTGGTNFADVRINNGDYRLTNGACVGKIRGFDGSFIQVNSEVNGSVDVDGPPSSRYFRYFMYSGTNHLDKIQIANSWFYQAAGVNILTNDLSVLGFFDDYGPVAFGSYSLDSGIFFCSSIYVGLFGDFYQSNGTNTVTKSVFINPGGGFTLAGGTLQTSNTVIQNHYHHGSEITVGTRFGQSSGAHIVADTLSVSGDYLLSGGILSAKDILLRISSAFEIIGTDLGPLITNTGQFIANGTLRLVGSTQQLGVLQLAGDAAFDFTQTAGELRFQNSSAAVWTNNAILTITNWIGSTRLVTGSNAAGLTPTQLAQIRFVNPAGLPAGLYYATILPTGELVPASSPYLVATQSGNSLTLAWPAGFTLESATNAPGLYAPVPGATSPYITGLNEPQRFFRLKQ